MALNSRLLRCLVRQYKFVNFSPVAVKQHEYQEHYDWTRNQRYGKGDLAKILGSVLVASSLSDQLDKKQTTPTHLKEIKIEQVSFEAGGKRLDLPTYRADDVRKHDSKKSFWVIYKHGVYDVTDFINSHPGGEQILNAAGLSIEPFWNVYGMHKTEEVYRLLETYRIGNLHDDDIADYTDDELWAREPARHRGLAVKTARPFNAEIPPHLQIEHFDTPNELFYVRQHMPVPELDPASHTMTVIIKSDGGTRSEQFSLKDLSRFRRVSVRAALMCAGNRRSEMNKQVKPVKGISWTTGAISNAVWGGILLRDLLIHCGVDPADVEGKHVIFTGSDIDATGVNFSTSMPLHMCLDPSRRVVLATEMNGAPLPPDHGHPLRVVVPGAPAVRSVKWLESITISTEESPSHWHQKDYRAFNPSKTWETADFSTAPPVYSLPVTSAICDPPDGGAATVSNGRIHVRGYAYSGGGAKILRVDLTTDRGATWVEAAPTAVDPAPPNQHYAWMLWQADLPVPEGQGEVEVWVKATDSNFNTQPESFHDIWNIRGILSNAYHRVTVSLQR